MSTIKYHIELVKGKVRWHYRIIASNGQTLSSSQRYYSKNNAKRAALRVAAAFHLPIKGKA